MSIPILFRYSPCNVQSIMMAAEAFLIFVCFLFQIEQKRYTVHSVLCFDLYQIYAKTERGVTLILQVASTALLELVLRSRVTRKMTIINLWPQESSGWCMCVLCHDCGHRGPS